MNYLKKHLALEAIIVYLNTHLTEMEECEREVKPGVKGHLIGQILPKDYNPGKLAFTLPTSNSWQ